MRTSHLRSDRIIIKRANHPQHTVTPTPPQVEAEGQDAKKDPGLTGALTGHRPSDHGYMTESDRHPAGIEEYDRYFDLDDQKNK